MGDGHAATEANILRRFRELVTYCLAPRIGAELVQCVLDSMDVEITLFKGAINWTQSRIILLFNRQKKPGENTLCEVFPLEQVTLWALQIALMIAIRSSTPEHLLIHWCPLTRFETTTSGLSSLHDISEEACTIVRVTARATGDSSNTDRTPFFPVNQSMAKSSPMGIITGLDILHDPLAATLFKSLTSRSQGSLMYEQSSGGTAVALARIPKNIRCQKDAKRLMLPPQDGRKSVRTPDQEVGLIHSRAAERIDMHGQSPLQPTPRSANALGNIQHALNAPLRPFLGQWGRDLHALTSRQLAKQISNHCSQRQIVDSVTQIVRSWSLSGPSPFPISLGPIDDKISLFHPNTVNVETQECTDSTDHRLLIGAMSFILYCDHTISLQSVSDIFMQLIERAITKLDTNIRLAWGAVTLGNRLLVGLCQCLQNPCTCATRHTTEILTFLKTTQALIYCREQARNRNPDAVHQQYAIHSICFARIKACNLHPSLREGELGTIRSHGITHGDLMATVNFPTHGDLEIPAEPTFIHLLDANLEGNWTSTGPGFVMGDKITTLQGPAGPGVVHGFMTQNDGSLAVLIWFNETDKYMQLRPDQIQKENAALSPAKSRIPPLGQPTTAQTCISGCTLLANHSEGYK